MAGAKEQVIRVGQDDLSAEIVFEVALGNAFDRSLCANRHEDGGLDDSVRGVKQAGARARIRALGLEFEAHYFTTPCLRRISSVLSMGRASTVWPCPVVVVARRREL